MPADPEPDTVQAQAAVIPLDTLITPVRNTAVATLVGGVGHALVDDILKLATSSDVGLGNAEDTSDANKPVSDATQVELDLKAPLNSPTFTGTANFDVIFTSGNTTVSGVLHGASISSDGTISTAGDITAASGTITGQDVSASGDTSGNTLTADTTLHVTGAATFLDDITVSGTAAAASFSSGGSSSINDLTLTGAVIVNATGGVAIFNGTITSLDSASFVGLTTSTFTAHNTATFEAAVIAQTTLDVTGEITSASAVIDGDPVAPVVQLTQAAYDGLPEPRPLKFYVITDA